MTKPTGEPPKQRGPKPKHNIDPVKWAAMTPQERNAVSGAAWYARNKDTVNKDRKKRYHNDPKFRRKILKAAKQRRPHTLAAKAVERFEAMVRDKIDRRQQKDEERARAGKRVAQKRPRMALIDGKETWVYPTGVLALRVGRVSPVIRLWLERGVLPGATIAFGGKSFFSEGFITSIYEACRRVYFINGNGSRKVLKRLVLEELAKAGESWVPHNGTEEARVRPAPPELVVAP